MRDTHAAALLQPEPLNTIVTKTAEFDAALIYAGRLLEHAASNGLLPEGAPNAAEALIRDVVVAQEATRSGQLTPQTVIAFWIAYGRSAHLVEPITAATLAASKQISLMGMKIRATFCRGDHRLLDFSVHEHRDTDQTSI